jgi:hypothetical protein
MIDSLSPEEICYIFSSTCNPYVQPTIKIIKKIRPVTRFA